MMCRKSESQEKARAGSESQGVRRLTFTNEDNNEEELSSIEELSVHYERNCNFIMLNPYGTDVEIIIGKLLTYPYPTGQRFFGLGCTVWPRGRGQVGPTLELPAG